MVGVLDVGSIHPLDQYAVLCREHQALGLPKPWMPSRVLAHTWMFQRVDWISVPSMAVRDSFVRQGIAEEKLLLNPYGIDVSLFNPSPRPPAQGPFTTEHPLRVLVVAGLTPRKGSRLLIEICRHYEQDARVHFSLVGSLDPPYCFQKFKLPSNLVVYHPMPHSELVGFMHQKHVCFLPSLEEGFARVLIEAAGCGLTLLATPPTGLTDLLQHAPEAGYMLPDHHLSTAIEVFDHLIHADWPLCHSTPQKLRFYSRDAYQSRSVELLQCRLPNRP
jgi:glycosyltransferase involved in cell wall biosynthesis